MTMAIFKITAAGTLANNNGEFYGTTVFLGAYNKSVSNRSRL
jgi:hypothetical protein